MKLGRPDEAMDWLERMYRDQVAAAGNWENWKKGINFDIPLFNGMDEPKMMRDSYDAKSGIRFVFDYKIFDPIRDTERFQSLFAKVNALPDITA